MFPGKIRYSECWERKTLSLLLAVGQRMLVESEGSIASTVEVKIRKFPNHSGDRSVGFDSGLGLFEVVGNASEHHVGSIIALDEVVGKLKGSAVMFVFSKEGDACWLQKHEHRRAGSRSDRHSSHEQPHPHSNEQY